MPSLYVASTETFVGKSAVCVGLIDRARRDGFAVGYMKPVSVTVTHSDAAVRDEDAQFIREQFGLPDPPERIAPVLVTQGVVETIIRGGAVEFSRQLRDAHHALSRGRDLVVLEGANSWAEGAIVDLSADRVADALQAPVLLVSRYHTLVSLDAILAVQQYLGDRLLGVVLNHVEPPKYDYVATRVVAFLHARGIPVYAVLRQDPQLAGISVGDLHEHLGGHYFGDATRRERLVEHLLIGAMGSEAALSHFRRRTNKAVITGGDRTDLQLVALETSTAVLVLTGNIRPVAQVIDRADERGVAIICVADDTLTTVERAEQIFGHVRFKQSAKLQRFVTLLDEQFDFARLYQALGLIRA
jgi:BioD-like phosphotransacetylase family protein